MQARAARGIIGRCRSCIRGGLSVLPGESSGHAHGRTTTRRNEQTDTHDARDRNVPRVRQGSGELTVERARGRARSGRTRERNTHSCRVELVMVFACILEAK